MKTFEKNITGPDFNNYYIGVGVDIDRKTDTATIDVEIEKYVADDRFPFDKMQLIYNIKRKSFRPNPTLNENGKLLYDTITKLLLETEGERWGYY